MPKGGQRLGAGRPRGRKNNATLEIEEARNVLREMVFEKLEPILEAQLGLATGLWIEDAEHGRIYRQKPDKSAADLLLAHAMGRPTEAVEHYGEVTLKLDLF